MKSKIKFYNKSKDDRHTSLTSLFTVQKTILCTVFCSLLPHIAKKIPSFLETPGQQIL